jgi:hypothetical protein
MAIGIDLGMVSAEVAALTAGTRVRQETRWWSIGTVGGALVLSAAMNAFQFAAQATTTPFQAAGILFGIAVPVAIYALARQGASHYLDARRRG